MDRDKGLVPPDLFKNFSVEKKQYFLLTLHRPLNVDDEAMFREVVAKLANVSRAHKTPILFLVHPRTRASLDRFGIRLPRGEFIEHGPVGNYFWMLELIRNAKLVFTDSGGIQEEACVLKVPCVVLRPNTERTEALAVRSTILADLTRRN